jgi:predicted RNA binding protein YcfA (HicA-like mRNA interferase family)
MDKYPLLRPREIIAALAKIGYTFKSQKGSHAKYGDGDHVVIIPMHTEVARGTLKSILNQANLDLDAFLSLL